MNSTHDDLVAIAESLRSRILQKTGQRVRDLHVDCIDGRFVVRGRSPSYYLKQLALEATRDLLSNGRFSLSLDIQVS